MFINLEYDTDFVHTHMHNSVFKSFATDYFNIFHFKKNSVILYYEIMMSTLD